MCNKCGYDDAVIKPDGIHELDPCVYIHDQEFINVTVHVMKCKKCGHMEISWERQENTIEVIELDTEPETDGYYCKVFAVSKDWLVNVVLNQMDSYNTKYNNDFEKFMEKYDWQETLEIYNQAIIDGELIRETEVRKKYI